MLLRACPSRVSCRQIATEGAAAGRHFQQTPGQLHIG